VTQVRFLLNASPTCESAFGQCGDGHAGFEPPPAAHDSPSGPRNVGVDRMDVVPLLLLLLVIVVLLATLAAQFIGSTTIHDYERGLRFVRGRFTGLADAGVVYYLKPTTQLHILDVRPTSISIEGQEVMSADGVALKISLVARYVIGDAAAYVMSDSAAGRTMYLDIQLGLREVVASKTVDDILAARTTIGPEVLALVAPQVMTIGIELTAVEVRDVMLPADLKRAFAAVLAARHEGAAALERARGETAALRSLANAGRMVADNPGLLSLRVVQELSAKGGNTVVLGLDGSANASALPPVARGRRTAARGPASEG
jgi:regulator of protease activity HflC (stomatin/prohibitin superfamily)